MSGVRLMDDLMFLFHTGSIKRSSATGDSASPQTSFYSILVRLKASKTAKQDSPIFGFYSILVRLKVHRHPLQGVPVQVSIPYWFD